MGQLLQIQYFPVKTIFFDDTEIYRSGTLSDLSDPSSPFLGITSFPTAKLGAYAASLGAACSFSMSSPSDSESLTPGSVSEKSGILPENEYEAVDDTQVKTFWQRYSEYPMFLKKMKKRNRRHHAAKAPSAELQAE